MIFIWPDFFKGPPLINTNGPPEKHPILSGFFWGTVPFVIGVGIAMLIFLFA